MSDRSDEGTIHEAARRGDLDAVRRFVRVARRMHVEQKDKDGNTQLLVVVAAIAGIHTTRKTVNPIAGIRYLISKKANVEAHCMGMEPLRVQTSFILDAHLL